MIRKEVEKLRGTTFTDEEKRDIISPMLASDKKTKVYFFKKDVGNLSKDALQEKLNELILYGFVSDDTTIDDVSVIDGDPEIENSVIISSGGINA